MRNLLYSTETVLGMLLITAFPTLSSFGQTPLATAPELEFRNAVLVAGRPLQPGAIYRFPRVTTGVDAEVKLKTFSRPDITIRTIDNTANGFDKAFQPEFGWVNPTPSRYGSGANQSWYIDFEMIFYKAGTSQRQLMPLINETALDVDGGADIQEYVVYEKPAILFYDNPTDLVPSNPLGGIGTVVMGPAVNHLGIDTTDTGVMAHYIYTNIDQINFRIGARTVGNNPPGEVRMNSVWFKPFDMSPFTILPVSLVSFSAHTQKEGVRLSWQTALEKHISHFIVQRSTDGKTYMDLATVSTARTAGVMAYAYTDYKTPTAGTTYYRLQMVDEHGTSTYSDVRSVRLVNEAPHQTRALYPNPALDFVNITLPQAWQGKAVTLELFNSSGIRVQAAQRYTVSGSETMQLQAMRRGLYLLKATCGTEVVQERVVKN